MIKLLNRENVMFHIDIVIAIAARIRSRNLIVVQPWVYVLLWVSKIEILCTKSLWWSLNIHHDRDMLDALPKPHGKQREFISLIVHVHAIHLIYTLKSENLT